MSVGHLPPLLGWDAQRLRQSHTLGLEFLQVTFLEL